MSQNQTAPPEHMGRIMLIRHGRTAENKQSYVGWKDIPLNPVGIAQARAVAVLLAGERIDAVYSSPLSRALATAGPLAEQRGLSVRVRDALKEIDPRISLGIGVVDVKINHIETPDEIAARIERAVKIVGPSRIGWVHPDCGFWMLKRSVADRKIEALVKGRDKYAGV